MDCTTIEKLTAVGLATVLLGLAGAGAAAADFVAQDDEITVPPNQEIYIPSSLLLANDDPGDPPVALVITSHSLPFHGALSHDLHYTPDDDFWTVGSDSFTYTAADAADPGGETSTATVFLIAGFHSDVKFDVDFESDVAGLGALFVGGGLEVMEEAAISGEKGLRISADPFLPGAYMLFSGAQGEPPSGSNPGNGGAEIKIQEPPSGDLPDGSSAKVISGGVGFGEAFNVTLHKDWQGELGVIAEIRDDEDVAHTVPLDGVPYPLASGPHTLHLHWWRAPANGGGMRLLVDGIHVDEVTGLANNDILVSDHRVGIIDLTAPSLATLDFDDVEIWAGDSWSAAFDSLLLDGFEAGSVIGWSSVPETRPAVTGDAALTGSWGLAVDLDGGDPKFLVDDSPAGISRYNARFELDVRSSAMADGAAFPILELAQEDGVPVGSSHVLVFLGFGAGGYRLQAVHKGVGVGAGVSITPWFPISDGRHVVELKWQAATLEDGDNGALALRLDGQPAGELTGLANGGYVVESVRFGTPTAGAPAQVGGAGNTRGTLYLDGFESWVRSEPAILRDGFETDLDAWSNSETTSLEVSQAAALVGGQGLEVDLDQGGERYLIDDTPAAEKRYQARFHFDVNSLAMAEGDELAILAGADQDGVPVGQSHLQLLLKYSAASYHLQAWHRDLATGSVLTTGWIPVADVAHVVDLRWRAASNAAAANGELRFWIDGVLAGELVGLANGDQVIESIRLGADGVDAGSSGSFYLDSFRSWR